jgi:hypothetical protein
MKIIINDKDLHRGKTKMNKRKALSLFATALLAGGVLAGCGSEEKTTSDSTKTDTEVVEGVEETPEETAVVTVEESTTGLQIAAYKVMMDEAGKAKEGASVDWDLVSKTYLDSLQTAVSEVDSAFDQSIVAAIEAAKNNEIDPLIAKQLVDKTTQSYFYQKQKQLHKDVIAALEANDQAKAEATFAEIKFLASDILIPTAVKRDGYYELTNESSLEQSINTGLATQEEALKAGNKDDYAIYTQITDKSVFRSYYLAANSYAEKIVAAVKEGKTELELQNMQAEAWGFFQAIKGSLAGGDEAAALKIDEIFSLNTTPAETVNAEEVTDLFTKAFIGKILGYHEKTVVALEEGNKVDAQIKSLEGNMFLKAIELDLKAKLGEEKAAETLNHAEEWFNAVSSENKDEASTHSQAVVTVLTDIVK